MVKLGGLHIDAMIRIGDTAPAFSGRDQNGNEIALEALRARGAVVLYFYPKDFTRVCTQQACLFRDAYDELQGLGAEIVGISLDSRDSHDRFAKKHGLGFSLLADPDKAIARDYGVLRMFGVITKRVTFVIDSAGFIRGVFHFELSAERHLQEVKALLKTLAS